MYTKEAIQFALRVSNGSVMSVIDKMSDASTTFPTPNGGCHPLWVLGHLTVVEGSLPGDSSSGKRIRWQTSAESVWTGLRTGRPGRRLSILCGGAGEVSRICASETCSYSIPSARRTSTVPRQRRSKVWSTSSAPSGKAS